jgi:hypothetical protein
MRTWLGLIIAPVLALTDQSVSLALAGWSCVHSWAVIPHAVHLGLLLAALVATALSLQSWRATAAAGRNDEVRTRRHFLAGAATAVGLLSAATIAAMWIANWMLSPCIA